MYFAMHNTRTNEKRIYLKFCSENIFHPDDWKIPTIIDVKANNNNFD